MIKNFKKIIHSASSSKNFHTSSSHSFNYFKHSSSSQRVGACYISIIVWLCFISVCWHFSTVSLNDSNKAPEVRSGCMQFSIFSFNLTSSSFNSSISPTSGQPFYEEPGGSFTKETSKVMHAITMHTTITLSELIKDKFYL